ncbi:major facilitator superfamily domain-containing protein [Infundibulicybe gibba]|nr:major facilitator superfamily domain-containing protein [Infundibulicybe gibba]
MSLNNRNTVAPKSFSNFAELFIYYENTAGRLVIDPREAFVEFGAAIASKLKLTADGTKILWPQPTDDPEDPQNWSDLRKTIQLTIVILASIVPDFDVGVGIAGLFSITTTFHTTPEVVTDMTTNWAVFLLGWGGIFAVVLMRRIGRLPVLFWSQFLSAGFLVGCVFAPNLKIFTIMRCLTAFFATCPQVTGLYIVSDMYPFHLQARKLNLWVMGFIISPFLSPFAFGFLVPRAGFRWAYAVAAMYSAFVLLLIITLGRETLFDRGLHPTVPRPPDTFRGRIESLIGITGFRMSKHRTPWLDAIVSPFRILWRPHLLSVMVFEGILFGFSIGMNLTNTIFLGEPLPGGYGFSQFAIAGIYATPIIAVLIGQIMGRYLNDAIAMRGIIQNRGVFEAEFRLWGCYLSILLYLIGLVIVGAAFQKKLPVSAVIIGWGIREIAVMVNTVVTYAYSNDCFPRHHGEVSGLLNLFRTLGGFAMPYFQIPWVKNQGALQAFGCEAAIVVALFLLIVPTIQVYGRRLRAKFSI